jgi:hypothetical protein
MEIKDILKIKIDCITILAGNPLFIPALVGLIPILASKREEYVKSNLTSLITWYSRALKYISIVILIIFSYTILKPIGEPVFQAFPDPLFKSIVIFSGKNAFSILTLWVSIKLGLLLFKDSDSPVNLF